MSAPPNRLCSGNYPNKLGPAFRSITELTYLTVVEEHLHLIYASVGTNDKFGSFPTVQRRLI